MCWEPEPRAFRDAEDNEKARRPLANARKLLANARSVSGRAAKILALPILAGNGGLVPRLGRGGELLAPAWPGTVTEGPKPRQAAVDRCPGPWGPLYQ